MAKPKPDTGGALAELFKIDKGQIINEPDRAAVLIDRTRLEPNPFQPRRRFDAHSIAELGDNMKAVGQIEAITVRPHPEARTNPTKQNVFQIVAGERRWRAAAPQFGNLPRLRCVIRNLNDTEVLTIALSENAHRADVSPIEFASGLKRLKESVPGGTWDAVLEQVKIKRTHLFRVVGLLDLPKEIQKRIDEGDLNEKHGRALLEFAKDPDRQNELLDAIDSEGLSGNAALERAKAMRNPPKQAPASEVSPGGLSPAGGQTTGSGFDTANTGSGSTSTRGITIGGSIGAGSGGPESSNLPQNAEKRAILHLNSALEEIDEVGNQRARRHIEAAIDELQRGAR